VFRQLVVPKWIEPLNDEDLSSYAGRMARHLSVNCPCFVGGTSFGGFVALEMARHMHAKACFLIGSVKSSEELPWRVRSMKAVAGFAGPAMFGMCGTAANFAAKHANRILTPATRQFLIQLAEADRKFLRWASRAVLTWKAPAEALSTPIFQIHGARDRVLPVRLTRPDLIVPSAGHLLAMTHADDVNQFLAERMREVEGR
jgi:pimeloyl-ACP methyl ester carboxylesterase